MEINFGELGYIFAVEDPSISGIFLTSSSRLW